MNIKKILVTGGSGFLGSHVADFLSNHGHEVTIFDKHKSPYLKLGQNFINGDILNKELIDEVVWKKDIIYHFAGISDIDIASSNPVDTVKNNILGTTLLLESAYQFKVERFILASSLYVYNNIGSFYGTSKKSCEMLVENYSSLGLNYTILRYGSLYGPRAGEGNFLHKVILEAIKNNKIIRHGDGEELREYIHVLDAARLSSFVISEEFINKIVTISGTQLMKIKDLLYMIKEILNNQVEIQFLPTIPTHHYNITPYSFTPKTSEKLISYKYIDFGQGILSYISDIYFEIYGKEQYVNKSYYF